MKHQRKKPLVSRLKKARQRVQRETHTVEWIPFSDVLQEVKERSHAASPRAVEDSANRMWAAECFDLRVYDVGGQHLTKAEAFVAWSQRGLAREEVFRRWNAGAVLLQGSERAVDPRWKQERLARMKAAVEEPPHASSDLDNMDCLEEEP